MVSSGLRLDDAAEQAGLKIAAESGQAGLVEGDGAVWIDLEDLNRGLGQCLLPGRAFAGSAPLQWRVFAGVEAP